MEEERYYPYIDILKIIAIIAVIIVHASGYLLLEFKPNANQWWTANLFVSFAAWCVPIFIMSSGTLILGRTYKSIKQFYIKRFQKILIPAICWVVIYHTYALIIQSRQFEFPLLIKAIIQLHEPKGLSAHLWFIPVIAGLYLATPVIQIFVAHAPKKIIGLSLVFWFAFSIVIPAIQQFLDLEIGIDRTLFVPWAGYFVLGNFLHTHIKGNNPRLWIALFFIGFISTALLAFHFTSIKELKTACHFREYFSPSVFLMAVSFFLFAKNCKYDFINVRLIQKISNSIFGIYLIHIIFLNPLLFAENRILNPISYLGPLIGIPLLIIATFFMSFTAVVILKRIAIFRFIVP